MINEVNTSPKHQNHAPLRAIAVFWLAVLLFVNFFFGPQLMAQDNDVPVYDEVPVFLMIQGVGGYEMNVIYMNDHVYVPVADFFQFLKINHVESRFFDSISGFFLHENNHYLISKPQNLIVSGGNSYETGEWGLFKTETGLYMRSDLFGKAFGLNLTFNFRSLSLELKTTLELPVVKELRLEQMRKNVNRLKGEIEVDTTMARDYHVFRGGMADWSVISTQASEGPTDTRASLGLGAELFGGEANVLLNYSSRIGFDERQQQYRWRWANNDAKIVRQVVAGKIPTRSISSIYAPVIGVMATNTPTTFRKSFGSYILTDYTEPGWSVELYINNVIVDYTTADASGFFSFEVPMVYGTSQVTLKFYGPWGEERIKEQNINVPYNFLPKGTAEYNAAVGVVRDSLNSTYSRAETSVGLHRNITVGGGVEYLSSISTGNTIPFVTASARFLKNFLFSGDYAHGVKGHALLNYRLPSNLIFELDYTNYKQGQKAISFNYLEERKVSLSLPVNVGGLRSFARASYKQNVLQEVTYSSAELLLSTYIKGVSANVSGFANWLSENKPYIYSNVALGFKLGRNTNIRPQAQIDLTNREMISTKLEIERNFAQKAFLTLSYEENFRSSLRSIEVALRFDLPFAQASASARMNNDRLLTTESARGSFIFGSGNNYVHVDNRSSLGRAGITIVPFLDINHNGIRDKGEQIADGLNVRLNGGRFMKQQNDSLIRIMELEPFASYLLELDDNGFENIAWQLEIKTMSIFIDPNQFKQVNVPVKVMGEANGMVYLKTGNSLKGQSRIILNFYDADNRLVKQVLSESDGYYTYLGLAPGKYSVALDKEQIGRLGMTVEPQRLDFEILPMSIGDIVDDLSFTLTPPLAEPSLETKTKPETGEAIPVNQNGKAQPEVPYTARNETLTPVNPAPKSETAQKPVPEVVPMKKIESNFPKEEPKKTIIDSPEVVFGNVDTSAGTFIVQAGAYQKKESAENTASSIAKAVNANCGVVRDGKLYKIRLGYFKTEQEAVVCAEAVKKAGFNAFVSEAGQ
jgi:hypothetical protein